MSSILYLINCLPGSSLIRDYVTFHIYLPQKDKPSYIALSEKEAFHWPFICKKEEAPYLTNATTKNVKENYHPWYPISEGYNIARKAANTYFVLSSDIEFYPSMDLVPKFLNMLRQYPQLILNRKKPQVYALPVFELRYDVELPDTKEDLEEWLSTSLAMIFYEFVCPNCYGIPNQTEWLKAEDLATMNIFTKVQRNDKYASWLPIYISDNQEPFLMENMPRQAGIGKRLQDFTMCLLDYDYLILHPAYLIHSFGASKLNFATKTVRRLQREKEEVNLKLNKEIKEKLKMFYGDKPHCKI